MKMTTMKPKWIRIEGVELAREVEAVCVPYGCHVALTGGVLYKDGPRKDCDLIFYRVRQVKQINMAGLWEALKTIGLERLGGNGWCHKAVYQGKSVDCLFPEGVWIGEDGKEVSYGVTNLLGEHLI
jgi:hypothetical protein